jgi:hypothetical protein
MKNSTIAEHQKMRIIKSRDSSWIRVGCWFRINFSMIIFEFGSGKSNLLNENFISIMKYC